MPDLEFTVTGVEAVARGLTPLLQFKTRITSTAPVQAVLLTAQIQLQVAQRLYDSGEKQRLVELFGTPERWGQTLRSRLWMFSQATTGAFDHSIEVSLPVPCTFDLNIAAAKYFHALDGGEAPLLFLFSGSVFYAEPDGRLQVERISWNKECSYRLPIQHWKDLMDQHFPNCAWLYLRRDAFDRLWEFRRRHGLASWEEMVDHLLQNVETSA